MGGQSQFHEVLPAFIRNTTATIFVMKLSERLDEYPVIEYYDRTLLKMGVLHYTLRHYTILVIKTSL